MTKGHDDTCGCSQCDHEAIVRFARAESVKGQLREWIQFLGETLEYIEDLEKGQHD